MLILFIPYVSVPKKYNEDTKDIKITYGDLSISDDEGLPQDKTEDEIFYPSGVSIDNEK